MSQKLNAYKAFKGDKPPGAVEIDPDLPINERGTIEVVLVIG